MKKMMMVGLLFLGISSALFAVPAEARCEDGGICGFTKTKTTKKSAGRPHVVKARRQAKHRKRHSAPAVDRATAGTVVALIGELAPRYGVPTWFALRIAAVESGFNPRARGSQGEYGVFQIKCSTARGIGYRGGCDGLLDARTNVEFGLKHLQLAIGSSRGNLRLAASKHNGGLARRTEVARYVAQVF